MSPQGVLAPQPLAAAVSLAHEPGFAPASLLVLLTATGQQGKGDREDAGDDTAETRAPRRLL